MKESIEDLVGEFESGRMSRRKLVGHLTGLVAMVAGGAGTLGAQQKDRSLEGKPSLTPEDRKPFEEIARRKGVEIRFGGFEAKTAGDEKKLHLDMDMVEESIRSAIKWTGKTGKPETQAKLERLLKTGTDAQKVEFVLGSGKYHFPEDLEQFAKLSRLSGGMPLEGDCREKCEKVWYNICRCISLGLLTKQHCETEAREVCHIVCYNKP